MLTCLILAIIAVLNFMVINSIVLSVLLFIFYIMFFGYFAGHLFFKAEQFHSALGAYLVLCWVIVGESIVLILNAFIIPWLVIPLILFPMLIFVLLTESNSSNIHIAVTNKLKAAVVFLRSPTVAVVFCLFWVSWLASISLLVSSNTDRGIFTILDVVPAYYWCFFSESIFLFILMCYVSLPSPVHRRHLLPMASALLFTLFGSALLVFRYGFDGDPYATLAAIRLVFERGFRGKIGQIMPVARGLEAIPAAVAKLAGPEFNFCMTKVFFDSINPILASIFLPLFLLLFLRSFNLQRDRQVHELGLLAILFFPSFFYFSITVGTWMGGVFLLGTNIMILNFLKKQGKKSMFLLCTSLLATAFIHPLAGIYALVAAILGLIVVNSQKRNMAARAIGTNYPTSICFPIKWIMLGIIGSCVGMITIILMGGTILSAIVGFEFRPLGLLAFPSVARITSFFAPPWTHATVTLNILMGEGYNLIRFGILTIGIYELDKMRSVDVKIKAWMLSVLASYFFVWFFVNTFVQHLQFNPARIAFYLDLFILPICAFLLCRVFQEGFAYLSGGRVRKGIGTSIIILLVVVTVMSTIITSALPGYTIRFPGVDPPLLGRPTNRAISREEIEAVGFIANNSQSEYAVICSDEWLLCVAQPILGVRVYEDGTFNILRDYILVRDMVVGLKMDRLQEIAKTTNSDRVFLVFNNWFIMKFSIDENQLNVFKLYFQIMGGDYRVFGSEYKVYVFWIDAVDVNSSNKVGLARLTVTICEQFGYIYVFIAHTDYLIADGDILVFAIHLDKSTQRGGLNGMIEDTLTFAGSTDWRDQNGIPIHPYQDISTYARDCWYYRFFDMSNMAGNTITHFTIGLEDVAGTYEVVIADVKILDAAGNIKLELTDPQDFGIWYRDSSETTYMLSFNFEGPNCKD